MKVLETTLCDWVQHKVGQIGTAPQPLATPERKPTPPRVFHERSGLERRAEQPNTTMRGKEWRRTPDRRLPEVRESTLEEFNHWKNNRL